MSADLKAWMEAHPATKFYESKAQPGLFYWAELRTFVSGPNATGGHWWVVSQVDGYPATEAHDDWFANQVDADAVAKALANGEDVGADAAVRTPEPVKLAAPEKANRWMQLTVTDKPQARMQRLGSGALSDLELLAILLGSGSAKRDTITQAAALLAHVGSLRGLFTMTASELGALDGVGEATAAKLLAVSEVARRSICQQNEDGLLLNRADRIFEYMQPFVFGLEVEKFWVLCLNRKNRLLKRVEVTSGTATQALAHPREVFRQAIREGATAIVCMHNHPSGDPAPSAADLQITRQLREAAKAVDIDLLDHVILGRPNADAMGRGFYSFREAGLI